MIISRQKEFDDLLGDLKEKDIFIIGCGKCATKIQVGGEPEVLDMKNKLNASGKNVTGWTVLSSACNVGSWEEVRTENPGIMKSNALLVMSCSAGVSIISRLSDIPVYPALDTESLGGACREKIMKEQCGMCGECTVWMFGGICPYTQCPKGLLNGPCGGAFNGKCEVDERKCTWNGIYEKLKALGELEKLNILHKPKDNSRKYRRQTV